MSDVPTDSELEARLPWVPWRAALLRDAEGGRVLHLCRYCEAREGSPELRSSSQHQEHLNSEHPLVPA